MMNEEEIIKRLTNQKKYPLIEILRKFKREGIENFIITKPELINGLLDLYQKEKQANEELRKICYGKALEELDTSRIYEEEQRKEKK